MQREAELGLLDRLVRGLAEGRPAVGLVHGRPGTGRTSLLAHAEELARERGVGVVRATASPTETDLRFGVVSQLLPDAGAEVGEALRSPEVPDESAVPLLCGHFLGLGRRGPLLVVVDDAHLADRHSGLWLRALARRAHRASLMLLVSTTSTLPQSGADAPEDPWFPDASTDPGTHHVLRSAPLDEDGLARVVWRWYGGEPPAGLVPDLAAATGGNPAVLRAVLAGLDERDGVPPADLAAEARRDQVGAVLAHLSPELLSLLRAVAVAGRVLPAGVLAVLADLGRVPPSRAARLLRDNGLAHEDGDRLVADDAATQRVLADMCPEDRAELHARAAELAHRSLAADEDVAGLLLGAAPVGACWAVDALRRAAGARDRVPGDGPAARFLRRALREPVSEARRAELLVELAAVEAVDQPEAGDLRLVRVLLTDTGPGTAAVRLAAADLMLVRSAVELARQVLGVVSARPDAEPAERATMAGLYWLADDHCHGGRDVVVPAVPELPPEVRDPDLAGISAWLAAARGVDARRARRLARLGLRAGGDGDRLLVPRIVAARALMLTDDLDEALVGLDDTLDAARRRGLRSAVGAALTVRAQLHLVRGRVDEADEDLNCARVEYAPHRRHPAAVAMLAGLEVLLWLSRGLVDRAESAAATAMPPGASQSFGWTYLRFARGTLRFCAGNYEEALSDLRECGRRLLGRNWHNPVLLPWRSLAALAHTRCGRTREADRLFAEDRELAERWGTPTALGLTGLWRGCGSTGETARAALADAVRDLRASPARGWYAHALYELAAHHAAEGDGQAAAALLADCGRLTAVRTDGILRRRVQELTGRLWAARRPVVVGTWPELSETAERIVELVVRGMSTAQVADALSVSRRSVELHLTAVYRAFGVTGRAQLRAVLTDLGGVPAP
ncbi:LuxR family transcriptional regulator [Saccharothrix xinjiangensis]